MEELKADQYLDITGQIKATKQNEVTDKDTLKTSAEATAKIGAVPSVQVKLLVDLFSEFEKKRSQNYSQIFIRAFNIRGLIMRLREILTMLNVKHLYVFIDDFSELPRAEMEQVVDTILAPFNNWSDEFIKLKVAVYPGRLYAGAIDISKVMCRPSTHSAINAGMPSRTTAAT